MFLSLTRPLSTLGLGLIALLGILACAGTENGSLRVAEPPASRRVDGLYRAEQAGALEVTLENLYESEQFWPHQIQLVEDWKPAGWQGDFGWGMGVLIRVSEDRRLRVDFSRFGKHWIPAEATDVLERANAIRLGRGHKYAPNLILALQNRLLDPTGPTLLETEADLFESRAFLLVFVNPTSPEFQEIAESLAPLSTIEGLHLVLISEGESSDAHIYKASYDARWRGSFLLGAFASAYSEGFLDGSVPLPAIQLATPEGRVLLESTFREGIPERVREGFSG